MFQPSTHSYGGALDLKEIAATLSKQKGGGLPSFTLTAPGINISTMSQPKTDWTWYIVGGVSLVSVAGLGFLAKRKGWF